MDKKSAILILHHHELSENIRTYRCFGFEQINDRTWFKPKLLRCNFYTGKICQEQGSRTHGRNKGNL